MKGKNAKNLEDTLIKRLNQVDDLINANSANEKNIKTSTYTLSGKLWKRQRIVA